MHLFSLIVFFTFLFSVANCYDYFWESFKEKYNRKYDNETEHQYRYNVFKRNLRKIVLHNIRAGNGEYSFTLGLNQFADLTTLEFTSIYNGFAGTKLKLNSSNVRDPIYYDFEIPDEVDWRQKNLVTPVKNQGQCGSCWAFSAVASLEGQHAKSSGILVSLSEQNLVDCSKAEGNEGCNGGLMDNAFKYIEKQGIDTEKSYPYKGDQEKCHFNPKTVGATMKSFVDIKSGDELALQEAVAHIGPISVAIDAGSIYFQLYHGGVFDHPHNCHSDSDHLDHGVTVVGYGHDKKSGKDYWLVKNSWGNRWGLSGYIKMVRNKHNQCGIATSASYPIV